MEKLREKILHPVIPALGPGAREREGRDLPMVAPSFQPVIPHLPLHSRKGHRAVRLGRMGKQGFCQRDEISMERVSPPQAATIDRHQPGSTSPKGSGGIGRGG